jgi:hypothetical protein
MIAHEENLKSFLIIYHHADMEPVHVMAFEELYNSSFEQASEILHMCLPSISAFSIRSHKSCLSLYSMGLS